jgi:hypothetical protein
VPFTHFALLAEHVASDEAIVRHGLDVGRAVRVLASAAR